ncbi:FAD-dependent oxidoreductase [Marinilongibacter aquaticus]|uniref:FAD-dependent oxidoreductase n=1 Tax=Marinilongibacter aquaticus TaxID=2975157 RepID=UPI0021BD13AE|nr:FAD-dependent oxidoreductase [Marinilongibacter aquaticus]UBM57817.1 FAD-dependent oxidoreductase [Marinilongibacter aquaticus]
MKKIRICLLPLLLLMGCKKQKEIPTYDVIVFGATSSGVMTAVSAKSYGKSVLILEPYNHLGGLSSGGLGQTDIGHKDAITGLAREFYKKIGGHYGQDERWTFEPSVAKSIFQEYLDKYNIPVEYGQKLVAVDKKRGRIEGLTVENGERKRREFKAKMFVDCSYEGDLMARAGVGYVIGREDNREFNETWDGVHVLEHHQFPEGIDPYLSEGDSTSGLLWGILSKKLAELGSGDDLVQAYNFRLCLTDSVENRLPIERPANYDSTHYELLWRYIRKAQPKELNWALMHIQPMPNAKTDINNSGPFSTDMIGANYDYPEADYNEREAIIRAHKSYTLGFLYFLGHDPRVPKHLREEMLKYGLPKDEYVETDHFTPQLYVRETRRMRSGYVMTEHNCWGEVVVDDGIGMAAYAMDSHNTQRLVIDGMVKNEGDVQKGWNVIKPYPVSFRAIVPKKEEVENLIVPVCLSATHIAYGSIRMEPVFMVLGQSAGLIASMALDKKVAVQDLDVAKIQSELKANPLGGPAK